MGTAATGRPYLGAVLSVRASRMPRTVKRRLGADDSEVSDFAWANDHILERHAGEAALDSPAAIDPGSVALAGDHSFDA
jgi:hypothetical protein